MRLREIRERLGVTQADITQGTGISRTTISAIENGKRPYPSTLQKLAKFLGVPVTELTAKPGASDPKADAPLSPSEDEEWRKTYMKSWINLVGARESRLREAMQDGTLDLEMIERAGELHRDIEEFAAPALGTLPEEAHDLFAALDGLRSTIDAAYGAAINELLDRKASVKDIQPGEDRKTTEERTARSA